VLSGVAAFIGLTLGQKTSTLSLNEIENNPPPGTVRLWNAHNPQYVDHFYSTNKTEVEYLMTYYNYRLEGRNGTSTGYVYISRQPDTVPLYRLFALGVGNHMYTIFPHERDLLIRRHGYTSEGIIGYIHTSEGPGRLPLYRLYNRGRHDHFYTTSSQERDGISRNGWFDEGIMGYIMS